MPACTPAKIQPKQPKLTTEADFVAVQPSISALDLLQKSQKMVCPNYLEIN